MFFLGGGTLILKWQGYLLEIKIKPRRETNVGVAQS